MPDRIEESFAALRTDTLYRVRPPGTDAVRRTVRRRRTTTAAAVAVAVLVLVSGTVALFAVQRPRAMPADRGPLSPAEQDRLAETAARAVADADPGQDTFADHGPVSEAYVTSQLRYLGELTLYLACAGAGSITLLIRGVRESGSPPGGTQLARVPLNCAALPRPGVVRFVADGTLTGLVVELAQAGAAGRAGFAYRVVSDTGTPMTAGSAAADAKAALHLSDPLPAGYGLGAFTELDPTSGIDTQWQAGDGPYRLAVACAGTGSVHVEAAAVSLDVPCSYPPRRRDVVVGRGARGTASMSMTYRSSTPAPARLAYQLLPV